MCNNCPFFTREEANEILEGKPDGSFILREDFNLEVILKIVSKFRYINGEKISHFSSQVGSETLFKEPGHFLGSGIIDY